MPHAAAIQFSPSPLRPREVRWWVGVVQLEQCDFRRVVQHHLRGSRWQPAAGSCPPRNMHTRDAHVFVGSTIGEPCFVKAHHDGDPGQKDSCFAINLQLLSSSLCRTLLERQPSHKEPHSELSANPATASDMVLNNTRAGGWCVSVQCGLVWLDSQILKGGHAPSVLQCP